MKERERESVVVGLGLVKQALSGSQPNITALVFFAPSKTVLYTQKMLTRITKLQVEAHGGTLFWFCLKLRSCAAFSLLLFSMSLQASSFWIVMAPLRKTPRLKHTNLRQNYFVVQFPFLCITDSDKRKSLHTVTSTPTHTLPDLPTDTLRPLAHTLQSVSGLG